MTAIILNLLHAVFLVLASFSAVLGLITSISSRMVCRTRSYCRHTAWETLAIAALAEAGSQYHHHSAAGVLVMLSMSIYSLIKSTAHHDHWQAHRRHAAHPENR